jgi:neopullulanase
MKTLIPLLLILAFSSFSSARVQRVEPANWWAGMSHPELQILLHGQNIGALEVKVGDGLAELIRVERVPNPNYLFLFLNLDSRDSPGMIPILFFENGLQVHAIDYPLWERAPEAALRKGFDSSDVMYLLMPDRFANGDPSNDRVAGMRESAINRNNPYGRHGGDLQGIIQNLDYFERLGVTALWLNPVMENDMPDSSYHGYAITDFYKVDPRFGTNETYLQLAREASKRDIKLVMDQVLNHCGLHHWWMKDLPTADWINGHPEFRITNHRRTTNLDPYAAASDAELNRRGWFVDSMPDLNLENPLLSEYMIQNSIWWVEYLGLGGIRMDTYPYPDKHAMARWAKRLMQEYPNFNLTGEDWSIQPLVLAYWQRGQSNHDGYEGHLPSLIDFPLQDAIQRAFQEEEGWSSGLLRIYETLALDGVYPDPNHLVTFLGNHDMPRFFMETRLDPWWYKNALALLLTTRGIPHLFYGDEILMTHIEGNGHGVIRKDFPGGWVGDLRNAFTGTGLGIMEQDALAFTIKLLHWRKQARAVHEGSLVHYAPENGTYVYFRKHEKESVMVVINKNTRSAELDLSRFSQDLDGQTTAWDVIREEITSLTGSLSLTPKQPYILTWTSQ